MTEGEPGPRVVVVTGASGGIGRATAAAFGRRGDTVALLARGETGLKAAADQVRAAGGTALAIPTDVADSDQVSAAAERVERELGPKHAQPVPPIYQLRGNLPQAFVHALLLECAQRLAT